MWSRSRSRRYLPDAEITQEHERLAMGVSRRDLLGAGATALSARLSLGATNKDGDAHAAPYFPPPDSAGGWRTLTKPGEIRTAAGVDLERLDQAFEYTRTTSRHGGLLVIRRGHLIYEKYFGRARRGVTPNMASCGKMFTSLCWGILMHQSPGAVPDRLDEKIFTPKYLPEAFPLKDQRKSAITLGNLITMTSGLAEGSGNIAIVRGEDVNISPRAAEDRRLDQDQSALQTQLWNDPGSGYFYSSQGVHIASIVLRHLAGMEMQGFIDQKLAKPLQFGGWGYDMQRADGQKLQHTPGGGGIALRSTDALRFGYLLLHNGRWKDSQIVPAEYVGLCRRPSPYNPHSPFSLQFEINTDGHVAGAPRDAFFKSGAGGFCMYVVPSLDLVVYKMSCIGLVEPQRYDLGFGEKNDDPDKSRDNWKPHSFDQFHDGPINGDAGTRRTLEMVIASVV